MCSFVSLAAGDSLGLHLDVFVGKESERSALQHVSDLVLHDDLHFFVVVQFVHLVVEIFIEGLHVFTRLIICSGSYSKLELAHSLVFSLLALFYFRTLTLLLFTVLIVIG